MLGIYGLFFLFFLPLSSQKQVLVDMTHSFDNTSTIYWPTMRKERFTLYDAGSDESTEEGYYTSYKFCAAEHGGTHLDAPKHFAMGAHASDEIPLDRLVGFAHVIDASAEAKLNRDLKITAEFLEAYERSNGRIPDDVILLIHTGFSSHWPNLEKYLGTSTTDPKQLHFPGLERSSAEWLVKNRRIKSLGIDTASIDHGQSTTYDAHRVLMKQNIPAFENVKDIGKIAGRKGVMIYALPMKIKGGSGGPLRIIASYDDAVSFSNSLTSRLWLCFMALMLMFLAV